MCKCISMAKTFIFNMSLTSRETLIAKRAKTVESSSALSHVYIALVRDSPCDLSIVLWQMFVVIVFLKPAIVDDFPLADLSFNLARLGLSLLFVLRLFVDVEARQDVVSAGMFSVGMLVVVSTLVHHEALSVVVAQFVPIAGFLSWLYLNKDHLLTILFNGFIICGTISILNFGSQLIAPEGLLTRNEGNVPVWLLGQKQEFLSAYLFFLFSGGIVCVARPSTKKIFCTLFSVVVLSTVIARTVGLLLVCCLVGFQLLVGSELIYRLLTRHLGACCLLVICFSLIVGVGRDFFASLLPFFEGLPTSGLSKAQTMGNRLDMWSFGVSNFFDSPLIGVGRLSDLTWRELSGLDYYHTVYHNFYLDLAASGGVFCVGIFTYFVFKIGGETRSNCQYSTAKLSALFSGAILLLMVAESPFSPLVLGIMGCSYYCGTLQRQILLSRKRNDSVL